MSILGEKWLIGRVKLPSVEDYLPADRCLLLVDETVFLKVIKTLNETIGVVLEYLKDAKEHGKKRGDDLLASVRVTGSYLAETLDACKDQSDGLNGEEDSGSIFLACDTVMNILLKREQIGFSPEFSTFSSLLKALAYWADGTEDPSVVMMAASICSLICDFTSEEALLKQPSFNGSSLDSLARLIARRLSSSGQDTSDTADLLELITGGYSRR
ncbi:unnamed protein product [Brassica oleracea]